MRTFSVLIGLCLFLGSCSLAQAQYADADIQDNGRYVVAMIKGSAGNYARATLATKTPVVVLDTYLGIVWRAQNIQEDKPRWIKNDLAKMEKPSGMKRYVLRILEWPSGETKIPALVLDIEAGKVWVCANILSESAVWVQKDLPNEVKDEGYKYP